MKVAIFRPFADPYRFSMGRYADAVERRVALWLDRDDRIVSERLPDARLTGWARYWDQYVRYQRFAHGHAADVNHIIDHSYAHLARSLPRHRTIVTFHDAVAARVPGASLRTRLAFRYNLRALRLAAAVICPSQATRDDLQSLISIPDERLHVIPLGVDETFRPAPDRAAVRRKLQFSGDVVLIVGHTQTYHNVERMLRAVGAVVHQHHLNVMVVKIGLPFTPEQSRLITELELSERVRIVGRVPDEDLPEYYQAADVLLYAPLLAGFGLPPLEAMACGTPVVASNRGSLPEVAGDAAVTVEPDDETAIAAALALVLTDPVKRRRMMDAGFDRAGRYEWTETARRLVELYRAVARG